VRGFSACGLRKASMTRLAEAGCSVHEIQAFSGHKTLSEIAHYTSSVEQAALARKAMAKTPIKLSKNAKMRAKTTAESLDGGGRSPDRTCLQLDSLLTGKNAGNFAENRPSGLILASTNQGTQRLPAKFPMQRNREFANA